MNNRKFYRNKAEISGIEAGSLWELKNNMLVLVDSDNFKTLNLYQNRDKFKETTLSVEEIKKLH